MKKFPFFLCCAAFFYANSSYAQTDKHSQLLGGDIGINSYVTGDTRLLIGQVNPMWGYLIANNAALGAQLNFSFVTSKEASATTIGLSPFFRYYFGKKLPWRIFG